MATEREDRKVRICDDCVDVIVWSGPMGSSNLLLLARMGDLEIVTKDQCQRCQALKEHK